MKSWTILDYVDDGGTNVIHEWLHGLPKKGRAKINTRLGWLSAGLVVFGMPNVRDLSTPCQGLLEVRVGYQRVEYRPLGFRGPRPATSVLLAGAKEENNTLRPHGVCETAKHRLARVQSDPEGHTCEHNFD